VTLLRARSGIAFRAQAGDGVVITNTHGGQVVDTWILDASDPDRHASAAMTWMATRRLLLREGDDLIDTRREPIARLVADSSPGDHDLLVPSCDIVRYRQLGVEGYHDNCRDNFFEAIASVDVPAPANVPAPFNLFMHVPIAVDGSFEIAAPRAQAGDAVELTVFRDALIVLSACPQDIAPTNGIGVAPRDVDYEIRPHG
jgi:uncharacterized protein